jgi:hypothetical protein
VNLWAEIQRLVPLVEIALSRASAALLSYAGVIVANEAEASSLTGLGSGKKIFILTHRSIWVSDPSSTAPLKANEVIARAGGGRLLRTTYSDPSWRTEITDIYIDDVMGNGENQGFYAAPSGSPAYITGAEFSRRWGRHNTVGVSTFFINLHIADASEIPSFDCVLAPDTFPRIIGEKTTVVLGPIALTAFTAQNPSTPAPGGTPCSIQVGATVWTPYLRKRIRRVSDGSVACVLKNIGGGVARISQPGLTHEDSFDVNPTAVNWSPGDIVVVEDLVPLTLGHVAWGHETTTLAFESAVNVLDVTLRNGDVPFRPVVEDGFSFMVVYQSVVECGIDLNARIGWNNCIATKGIFGNSSGCEGFFYGGAVIPAPGGPTFNVLTGEGGSLAVQLDYFTYFQGCCLISNSASVYGGFSVWDAPIVAGVNVGGHGFLNGGAPGNAMFAAAVASQKGNGIIFGSGNAGRGYRGGAGTSFVYTMRPNITGADGDLMLGDSTVAWWWDPTAGGYKPAGAGIALSWAAIAAATPGGFGGHAHEPNKRVSIVAVATS